MKNSNPKKGQGKATLQPKFQKLALIRAQQKYFKGGSVGSEDIEGG